MADDHARAGELERARSTRSLEAWRADLELLAAISKCVRDNPEAFRTGGELLDERDHEAAVKEQRELELVAFDDAVTAPIMWTGVRERFELAVRHYLEHGGPGPSAVLTVRNGEPVFEEDSPSPWASTLEPRDVQAVVLLTWLMVDPDAHVFEPVLCRFQRLPFVLDAKIDGHRWQGRDVVADDVLGAASELLRLLAGIPPPHRERVLKDALERMRPSRAPGPLRWIALARWAWAKLELVTVPVGSAPLVAAGVTPQEATKTEDRALALIVGRGRDWTVKGIAENLGVARSTLYRLPRVKAALHARKTWGQRPALGVKADGRVEAAEDDE